LTNLWAAWTRQLEQELVLGRLAGISDMEQGLQQVCLYRIVPVVAPRHVAEAACVGAGARQFAPLVGQVDNRLASALLVAVPAPHGLDVLRPEHDAAFLGQLNLVRSESAFTSYWACEGEGTSDTSAGFKIGDVVELKSC